MRPLATSVIVLLLASGCSDSNEDEPRGVKLAWYESRAVEAVALSPGLGAKRELFWGATLSEVRLALLGDRNLKQATLADAVNCGDPSRPPMACRLYNFMEPVGQGWYPDFGPGLHFPASLLFCGAKLCGYRFEFEESALALVRERFTTALGEPSSPGTWRLENVTVELDRGLAQVTFRPLFSGSTPF